MNNKIVTDDNLPHGWIKRQSKSRPDHIYYFNTKTKESQWTLPVSIDDKQQKQLKDKRPAESPRGRESNKDKRPAESPSGREANKRPAESPKVNDKNDGKSLKISNNSKQIKKSQTKTPAQDRLQNLAKQIKHTAQTKVRSGNVAEQLKNTLPTKLCTENVAELLKNTTPGQYRHQNYDRRNRNNSNQLNVIKKTNGADVNKSKSKDAENVNTSANNIVHTAELHTPHKSFFNNTKPHDSSDEIPILFPPKTPGQDRLNQLRNSLNPDNENTPNESAQLALSIIQSEFGLSSAASPACNNHNATIDEDEPMDWEPCDIFEEVENVIYSEFKHAYIVPDTNVLLDELSCIRGTIHSEDNKYNVLVPFVVLQELDRLKGRTGDSRISSLASGAIRFIFNELKSKTQRLQGQKATEDCLHLIDVACADDKILNCCLQQLQKSRETILISNDINLCNKAIASGVQTMTSKEYKAETQLKQSSWN